MQTPRFHRDPASVRGSVRRGAGRSKALRFVRAITLCAICALTTLEPVFAGQSAAADQPSVVSATHFLGQATFGASAPEIEAVRSKGFQQWLLEQAALPRRQDIVAAVHETLGEPARAA